MRRGQAVFQPRDVEHAAFDVYLGQPQPAGLRHAQPVAKHQEQQAAVTGRVAASLRTLHELFDFGGNEVFAVVHHFVQCLG